MAGAFSSLVLDLDDRIVAYKVTFPQTGIPLLKLKR